MDFWYDLDYSTNADFVKLGEADHTTYAKLSPEVNDAIWNQIFRATVEDGAMLLTRTRNDIPPIYDRYYRTDGHSPMQLKRILEQPQHEKLTDAVNVIAEFILSLMEKHFKGDKSLEQRAFELFGQGTMYDNLKNDEGKLRRPPSYRIHMMDGSTRQYDVLNKFLNVAELLGIAGTRERWTEIGRYMGLGAEVDYIMKPKQSLNPIGADPHNKPIDGPTLSKLQNKWSKLSSVRSVDYEMQQIGKAPRPLSYQTAFWMKT